MMKKTNASVRLCLPLGCLGFSSCWHSAMHCLSHQLTICSCLHQRQFDRSCKHKDQQTIVFILFQWNTVFLWKGTYLDFEVAHVCVGGRSEEGRRVGRLVWEGEARAPPPLLTLQTTHHHQLPHHLKVELLIKEHRLFGEVIEDKRRLWRYL